MRTDVVVIFVVLAEPVGVVVIVIGATTLSEIVVSGLEIAF